MSSITQDVGRRRRFPATRSQVCVICKDSFECSINYKGQKFACWNCRMSSEALERGFTCPITNTIMFNPTVASDGHCYESHAIQVWIATAVDNEKQPLSPVTGLPLVDLILKKDKKKLQQIEDFVKKNKLHQHPDRVKPPTTTDIEKRQRDISTQAAQWLTEATPSKQERPGSTETTDMAEYAAQSTKRRKEEIAAGADLALAVRSARQLAGLLKELDCVRSDDTLATAIGSSIDFLTPNAVNDCFYICRERNRIVHESSAGDELTDVQRFRSAFQRARREIQVQIDIQNSYKFPTPAPVPPPPPPSPSVVSSSSLASSPPTTSSVSTPSPVVKSPTTSVWKTSTTFAKRLTSSVVSKTPSPFKRRLPSTPSTMSTSSSAGSPSTISSASTPSPDVGHLPGTVPSSAVPTPSVVVKRQPATVSPAAPTPSPGETHPPAILAFFDRGLHHFHKGEYSLAIATLTAFTRQVDGEEYSDRLAVAKSTIEIAQSRPKALKEADDAFHNESNSEAFRLYNILTGEVQFGEDCYAMVMFRMGLCCTTKTAIPCFSDALRKEPGNGDFLHHRALAYMELEDFKSAKIDLESIDLTTVDTSLAREVAEDLEFCRPKADPMCRRGHLEENEIDDLMKRFGLED